MSGSRLRLRADCVEKRGSEFRSLRPITSSSAVQNFSVRHITKTHPSAVGSVCTGASEKCALRVWRSGTCPSFRYQIAV